MGVWGRGDFDVKYEQGKEMKTIPKLLFFTEEYKPN